MWYGRYRFSLILDDDAVLPEYKGSTFRGIFGHALKKVVCALKRQDCRGCLLYPKCIYAYVFETPAPHVAERPPVVPETPETGAPAAGLRHRLAAPPHPYVIEPPDDGRTRYRKGDTLDFTLLLFGRANEYLPYFVYAFKEMGALGIGRRIGGKRANFVLDTVVSGVQPAYESRTETMHPGPFAVDLGLSPTAPEARQSRLTLSLRTPLRLKFENAFKAELPFHVLTRAMLRRVAALDRYFGDGEPPLDYRGLVARAKAVETEASAIRWFDWRRYSNRQDQAMLMGGMVGEVTYAGDLGEFLPLLHFCEQVHLGKQTAFGLGRIAATVPEGGGEDVQKTHVEAPQAPAAPASRRAAGNPERGRA